MDSFLEGLEVGRLHGVGHVLAEKLLERGVHTCGDLRKLPRAVLQRDFGERTGEMLFQYCRGQDTRTVISASSE